VCAAARNWAAYSNDFLGEPAVRSYRELPLEADPPRHREIRDAVQPRFLATSVREVEPRFEALADCLLGAVEARGGGEVVSDIALPYVVGCLTILFDRPLDHGEWLSWGADVWDAGPGPRNGTVLAAYLDRVLGPNADVQGDRDMWAWIRSLEIAGRRVEPVEAHGIASLVLSGGRDTVVKLVSGLIWHLVQNSRDREEIEHRPDLIDSAVAEMTRWISPLPAMWRQTPDGAKVELDFASANHDAEQWSNPDQIDIRRPRQAHLAFGFGRHACMGKAVAEAEARIMLRVAITRLGRWEIASEPQIRWMRIVGTDSLVPAEFLRVPVVVRPAATS